MTWHKRHGVWDQWHWLSSQEIFSWLKANKYQYATSLFLCGGITGGYYCLVKHVLQQCKSKTHCLWQRMKVMRPFLVSSHEVPQDFVKSHRNLEWHHPILKKWPTLSALLALCEGNPSVTGGFPLKGQWRGALMFSLICAWTDGEANNRDACRWFETPSRSIWRHCNDTGWWPSAAGISAGTVITKHVSATYTGAKLKGLPIETETK